MGVIEDFKAAHSRIEAGLAAAEVAATDATKLASALKSMRRDVVQHFQLKDAFYVSLAAQCVSAKDAGAAQLTKIFESNMKMQSAAVTRFFETLDTTTADAMSSGFRTMLTVIRQRFGTEEKAVFPLFVRTAPKTEGANP